ncbi:aminoglycoside phosphotransferase family protein [Parasedimentitalea psychrophila]|uniref:Phosphotransferase n=1 Tax=Parasedimentitalea psychrophila TaxID=2997337 RepID=A0A9Y2L2F8_9RHOB|nr:phosphotransferase [Parasedimentitalea psychrophila]WIY26799.1 phosphotransferase [Parasedimentitalea psychrophila]
MTDRNDLAAAFLATTAWANGSRRDLAGDASNRRYERVSAPVTGLPAVLMDAPPGKAEDVAAFVHITNHLRDVGLSAPEILAADIDHGFLLIEDLGDDLYARILLRQPALETPLYQAATDVLVKLHSAAMPDLDIMSPRVMAQLDEIAFTHYRDGILGAQDPDLAALFVDQFEDILHHSAKDDPVLVQRDYHAENLLWLPDRDGIARVGLLDYQAALAGHRAYDLMSLLQDARRDVPIHIEQQMIDRYIAKTGVDGTKFRTAYTVLGLQRNLRILGVFARLSQDYGKPQYVDLIPRVWAQMIRGLDHPALAPVAGMIRNNLPPPTPENLDRLRP